MQSADKLQFCINRGKIPQSWAEINPSTEIASIELAEWGMPVMLAGHDIYFHISEALVQLGDNNPTFTCYYIGGFNVIDDKINNIVVITLKDNTIAYTNTEDLPDIRQLSMHVYKFRNQQALMNFKRLRDRLGQ